MLLIVDNYDSFVFNIVRYCAELGRPARVLRNDALSLDEIAALRPTAVILSPGPGAPADAGVSLRLVTRLSGRVPLLGICLGHQCIGAAFGGRIDRAAEPMHGRASPVSHAGRGLFEGLPVPLTVGRYHSLIVAPTAQMARQLRVTARSDRAEVMGLAHRSHPTFGVQFHPESVLSEHGHQLLQNFFRAADAWGADALA